jgi:O-antigen ligase
MGNPAVAFASVERRGGSKAVADQLLNIVLWITILTSSIAFIEPSPTDVLMFVLLSACILARVKFDRKLAPLFVLIALWFVGGCIATIVDDDGRAYQFLGTSAYLDIAAVIFACLFSTGDLMRLSILRRAYLIAALIATVAGYAGWFHLVPWYNSFLLNGRVSATFKDPNVYGPFLIFPLLMLMLGFLTRRVTVVGLAAMLTLAGGLFLSFSRGAWTHFLVSAVAAVVLAYAAAPNSRARGRIVVIALLAAFVVAVLVVALLSIPSIHDTFIDRAKVLEPYDTGSEGRFTQQGIAISVILDHPFGIGSFKFEDLYGIQQHNVYLQGFVVYGWLGGTAYLTLVLSTFLLGLRCVMMPTPWQIYLIAAYAAYIGEIGEGGIIDSDHWRHFFLLVGMVWGLSVANLNWRRRQNQAAEADPGLNVPLTQT